MLFVTREGNVYDGILIHQYMAFEGGTRYIIRHDGKEYRCVKDDKGNIVEFVV